MTRLQTIQLKGENCKYRWEAKGGNSKYITTMTISNYYYTTQLPLQALCVPQDNLVLVGDDTISVRRPSMANWSCRCWRVAYVGTDRGRGGITTRRYGSA